MALQTRIRQPSPLAGGIITATQGAGLLRASAALADVSLTSTSAYSDQASKLRSLVRQRARPSVLAITSGKGGVGKSNICVNLAIALAAAGKRIVLIDADLGLANADVLCNLDVGVNLSHVLGGQRTMREAIIDAPGGFKLVGGASGLAKMADLSESDLQRLLDSLGDLESQADLLLIDTGAGINPGVLSFTRSADHVLVVTTPEPTAITDAYAMIKTLTRGFAGNKGEQKISLLVNMARSASEGATVYERVAKVARQFLGANLLDAGYVLSDEAVPSAVRKRQPFMLAAPRSAAAHCVTQLAMRLQQGCSKPGEEGFFTRFARCFRRR